jgi:hypothetical protein
MLDDKEGEQGYKKKCLSLRIFFIDSFPLIF